MYLYGISSLLVIYKKYVRIVIDKLMKEAWTAKSIPGIRAL